MSSLTELARLDDNVFCANGSGGPGRMYGGEVAARALAAARRTVPADRAVHVVQSSFLRAGDPATALILRVTRLRDGRAFSMRRVDAEQRGKVIFTAIVSFHAGSAAVEHHDPMPVVPSPEELDDVTNWTGRRCWPDWAVGNPALELRPVPGDEREPAGLRAIWYRLTEPRSDGSPECQWLWLSDLTLVSSIRLGHEPTPRKTWLMTSLNHTVWFHRPFRVEDWHLVVHRSPLATGGRGLALGQVFDRTGVLVSSLAQEGLATPI